MNINPVMKSPISRAAIACFLAASVTGQAVASEAVNIGVATATSNWYFGYSEISRIVSANSPMEISVRESGGSRENMIRLNSGEIDLALVEALGTYESYNGVGLYENNPMDEIRLLLWVAPSTMHWAVRQDSGIETFEDLNGQRFNPSGIGGGGEYMTGKVFETLGVTPDFQRMSMPDAADAVVDGRIVGFSFNGTPPIPAFTEVNSSRPLRILSLTEEQVQAVTEASPFMSPTVIEADTYRGVPEATTLGVYVGIAANGNLSEELAYEFTRAYWENIDSIANSFAPVAGMTPEQSIENTIIPLHPGALRYYRELGIEVPEELVPPEAN